MGDFMLKELIKVANKLDELGLTAESDLLDGWIRKLAGADIRSLLSVGDYNNLMVWANRLSVENDLLKTHYNDGETYKKKLNTIIYKSFAPHASTWEQTYPTIPYKDLMKFAAEENWKEEETYIRKLAPWARGIAVKIPDSSKQNEYDFKTAFYNEWSKNPDLEFKSSDIKYWNAYAPAFGDLLWKEMKEKGRGAVPASSRPQAATKSSIVGGGSQSPASKGTAPIKDWSYYNSKQTDEFGKGMERFWFKNAPKLNLNTDFNSFVKYYRELTKQNKGVALSPKDFILSLILDLMDRSNDPLVRNIVDSEAGDVQRYKDLIWTYLGYNKATQRLSSDAEITAAGGSLKGISEVMGRALKVKKDQAEINKLNLEDEPSD
jgi:hypothetical protein